jgi:hypothetical protein
VASSPARTIALFLDGTRRSRGNYCGPAKKKEIPEHDHGDLGVGTGEEG